VFCHPLGTIFLQDNRKILYHELVLIISNFRDDYFFYATMNCEALRLYCCRTGIDAEHPQFMVAKESSFWEAGGRAGKIRTH
jgi:hypothetical protein